MRSWAASNDQMTKSWRADLMSKTLILLHGPAIAEKDFAPSGALRLWEYGVSDTVRQSTFVSLRRVAPGVYDVQGDVPVEVTFAGGQPRPITAEQLTAGPVRLK